MEKTPASIIAHHSIVEPPPSAVNEPCMEHTQLAERWGYAYVTHHGKARRMHRVVYVNYHNIDLSVIDGLVVMHTCDNPRCINPSHLKLGTQKDNVRDRDSKGRGADRSEIKAGRVKLTEDQVIDIFHRAWSREKGYKIATYYNVSSGLVSQIKHGGSWDKLTSTLTGGTK